MVVDDDRDGLDRVADDDPDETEGPGERPARSAADGFDALQ